MKSEVADGPISEVEITQIDMKGVWLLFRDHEYFLSFEECDRLRDATVREIQNVELIDNCKLRWPDLDLSVPIESIGNGQYVPSTA